MDIRTRLSLALVFVSLLSMALLGSFAYSTSASLLQEISLRQLDALAESKKRDLIKLYNGWEDNLRLVRDRNDLQDSIKEFTDTGNLDAVLKIERIIQGITVAVTNIDKLIVFDNNGHEITSFGRSSVTHSKVPIGADVTYVGTFTDDRGGLGVALNTGIKRDGQLIGGLELIIDAHDLFDVTGDYTGLGDTGEAFVVVKNDENILEVLNPLRHSVDGFSQQLAMELASEDLRRVFSIEEETTAAEHIDYRGQQVWSATRRLLDMGWGLVVKVDASEEQKRAKVLQEALFDIAVALSAFAIIGGALLGYYLARPIQELTVIVERMRHGEAGLRAEVSGDDEIAYLAESLNEFLDHIEEEQQGKAHSDA